MKELITIFFVSLAISQNQTNSIIDGRDGKKYKTVKIGEQWWMSENLNYKLKGSYQGYNTCYYRLEDAKKACPQGWRLPTDADWMKLEKWAGMSESDLKRHGFRNGNAMKLKKGGSSGLDLRLSGEYNPRAISDNKVSGKDYSGSYWSSDGLIRSVTNDRQGNNFIARDRSDRGAEYICVRCIKED